jgi:hypothetical protein
VRNLHIKVTSQGAGSSGITPQGASSSNNLQREPGDLAHHHSDLIIVAYIHRKVSFPGSCGTDIDYKKFEEKMAEASKEV